MPKQQGISAPLMQAWLKKVQKGESHFKVDGNGLFCEPCCKRYSFKKITHLEQHVETAMHQINARRHDAKPERQTLLTQPLVPSNPFYADLCEAFLSADISWTKLQNLKFRNFLEKYTNKNIPDESTLRKNYLKTIYLKSLNVIRESIGDYPVWLSVDETTDAKGRYIANVIVGALKKSEPSQSHLIMCKQLEKTNNSTITQLVMDAFSMIWPNCCQKTIDEKFLLFVTDGVSYMKCAGENLKALYPKLLHVTCLSHAMNLVAEDVRSHYPDVDKLIGSIKAIFRKCPSRILKYREMYPELELPPSPIYIRWGTWLNAVEFYANHIHSIENVIMNFNKEDAKCIETAQELLKKKEIKNQICYISANFTFLCKTLKELQEKNLTLSESLTIVKTAENKIRTVKGEVGKLVERKLKNVLCKNQDYLTLTKICSILDGEDNAENFELSLIPSKVAAFKYAPITSVDTERSFSMYKSFLNPRRQNMSMENIEMSLVSHHTLAAT